MGSDRQNKWYVLARLAELVERGDATLTRFIPGVGEKHHFQVEANYDPQIEAGLSDEEEAAICETFSTRFMERALALGLKGPVKECSSEHRCVTCGAEPGNWCRSTHAGERDSGGWMHPSRETGGSHIGPLPDAKHVQDAGRRFSRMEFDSKWRRMRAMAKILDAGGEHHLDVSYLLDRTTQVPPIRSWEPDRATGEDLDQIAALTGTYRFWAYRFWADQPGEETDEELRFRTREAILPNPGNTRVLMRTRPSVADAGWVGQWVSLVDEDTVTLSTLAPNLPRYGIAARVSMVTQEYESMVEVITR